MVYRAKPLAERFWPKVAVIDDDDSCWEWLRAKDPNGYGKIGVGGKSDGWQFTHRVAYELQIGPIPPGMDVLHTCDNPGCVRGKHLFLGTQSTNMQDMASKGRQARQNPTACPKNHPYPENAVYYGKKRKQLNCRTCLAERRNMRRERGDWRK
jgi:hypothetical protein